MQYYLKLFLVFFILKTTLEAAAQSGDGHYYNAETARTPDKINKKFPYDIELKAADGKVSNSAQLLKNNGKPTVLIFWLTTCFPCRLELEAVKKNYENWKKEADFNLFAISTDFEHNYLNFVKRVQESNWAFPAFNDINREFCKVMPGELNGLPQVFLLDATGQIVYQHRRYTPGDEATLLDEIKKIAPKP